MKTVYRPKKGDVWLMVAALAAAALLFLFVWLRPSADGATVRVTVDDKPYAEWSLSENRTEEIVTPSGRNLVIIRDGTVRMDSADCPRQICVHHAPVSKAGEVIVCLPHRIVLEIVGGPHADVDTVI